MYAQEIIAEMPGQDHARVSQISKVNIELSPGQTAHDSQW